MKTGRVFQVCALAALYACGATAVDNQDEPDGDVQGSSPEAGARDATSGSDAGSDGATPGDDASADDAETLTQPPPVPPYSHGTCPKLVSGPTDATSLNTGFATGSQTRQFHVMVPKTYDGTKAYPLVFAWHWLNASASSFISDGELESAIEQMNFIAVLPDKLTDSSGKKTYQFDWPFAETWGAPAELTFLDDMFSCVNAQYKVDLSKVYGIGVSAGALWVTYVSTTDRANHFAAIESLSGGLGADPTGVWKMQYVAQPNKFPALVLWGGDSDNLIIVDFKAASIKYRDALRQDRHFVVQCTHDAGHAIPPVPEPTNGGTRFVMLWQFMLDHPYGLPPNTSPYQKTGLPPVFPTWCSIAP
jgi:hypothetical protein